jgi:hypothetical protein
MGLKEPIFPVQTLFQPVPKPLELPSDVSQAEIKVKCQTDPAVEEPANIESLALHHSISQVSAAPKLNSL